MNTRNGQVEERRAAERKSMARKLEPELKQEQLRKSKKTSKTLTERPLFSITLYMDAPFIGCAKIKFTKKVEFFYLAAQFKTYES